MTMTLAASGCGSSAKRSPDNSHSTAALKAAYTSSIQAYLKPNPEKFCSSLTEKGQQRLVDELNSGGITVGDGKVKDCKAAVIAAYALMKMFSVTPKETITAATVTGDRGTVHWIAKSAGSTDRGVAKLVYQNDRWLIDDMGGGDSGASDEQQAKADISRWLSNWCSLKPGMTKTQAIAKMGTPTTSYDATQATPQLNWEQGAYSFTAFMNTDNVLDQLQADYSHLGKRDLSKLSCPADRR
ncbi:MAG: hypothetical protein WBQ14_06310 [Gaiellaceae bacterium]